jgi:uncharacterized membrane protein
MAMDNLDPDINAPSRMALRWFLFGCVGLLIEVFFTSSMRLIGGNISAIAKTSPWMMLDYGMLGIALVPMATAMKQRRFPLIARAVVYALGIYVIEYVSGIAFNAVGIRIWDYSGHVLTIGGRTIPMHLHGQITLFFIPCWIGLGLIVEWLHDRVDAIAVVLLRGPGKAAA